MFELRLNVLGHLGSESGPPSLTSDHKGRPVWVYPDGHTEPYELRGGVTGSSATDYLCDAILNEAFRNTGFTAVAAVDLALFSVAPTDAYTTGSPNGTEFSGNAYARTAVTFGAPSANAPSGRVIANTGAVTFPSATPSAQGTVVAVGAFEHSTNNLLVWNTVTNKTISANDFYQVAIGNCTIVMD